MPNDSHLTEKELAALLEEDRTKEENRLLIHHLAVCPACSAVGGYILELHRAGSIGPTFSTVDIGFARSRLGAPGLWSELRQHSLETQREMVRHDPRFRSWGLCELLCDESLAEAPRNAAEAIARAELAFEIAGMLRPWEPAEPGWIALIQGYAGAHLANALRVQGDVRKAEEASVEAERSWSVGMADFGNVLGYAARYLGLKASLRRDERRLAEALDLLEQAIEAAAEAPALIPTLVLNQAKVLEELGDFDEAIRTLEELSEDLPTDCDERLTLCIEHNLLWLLANAGHYLEARLRFPEVAERSQTLGNELDLVRLRWVEATIAAGLGDVPLAAALLLDVRAEFEAQKMSFDAALVALELAVLYVRVGRRTEVMELADELVAMFTALGVGREALVTVSLFHEAAAGNRLTIELAEQVLTRIRREASAPTGGPEPAGW